MTSYPNSTDFIVDNIVELKLLLNVVWLGDNLRTVVDHLTESYLKRGVIKSVVFLEWTPGYFTLDRENLYMVSLPNCDEFKSSNRTGCRYEITQNVKITWDGIYSIAHQAFELIHKMRYTKEQYEALLKSYNNGHNFTTACHWIKNNEDIWSEWLPRDMEKKLLLVGGIFPLTGSFYNSHGIILAATMAREAINNDTSILYDYEMDLSASDGKCSADMVLKCFIDYIHEKKYKNLIGLLGPACSETVEPLAGISTHYSTTVISYSAEGSNFLDRDKYPYFFRTIGDNDQYKLVYMKLLKFFGWKRIAALTEDGQKYTEYISSMGDLLKKSDIELIANMKFPKGSTEASFTRVGM